MSRPSGSFSASSRLPLAAVAALTEVAALTAIIAALAAIAAALLCGGCGIDRDRTYAPAPDPFVLDPDRRAIYEGQPAISRDGRIIAFVRGFEDSAGIEYRILRLDLAAARMGAADAETVGISRHVFRSIDVSPGGDAIIAVLSPTWSDSLLLWRPSTGPVMFRFPPGYGRSTSPVFIDSTTVAFGGLGPTGYGVYSWNLATGTFESAWSSFELEDWDGSTADLDPATGRICFDRDTGAGGSETIVRDRAGSIVRTESHARKPLLWRIVPGEAPGIMYLDDRQILRGSRLRAGETAAAIAADAMDYDVSADGCWVFIRAVIEPMGSRMFVFPVKEPR